MHKKIFAIVLFSFSNCVFGAEPGLQSEFPIQLLEKEFKDFEQGFQKVENTDLVIKPYAEGGNPFNDAGRKVFQKILKIEGIDGYALQTFTFNENHRGFLVRTWGKYEDNEFVLILSQGKNILGYAQVASSWGDAGYSFALSSRIMKLDKQPSVVWIQFEETCTQKESSEEVQCQNLNYLVTWTGKEFNKKKIQPDSGILDKFLQ